jgi:aquaporin Z
MNEVKRNLALPWGRGLARQWDTLRAVASLRLHWPEYLMEGGEMSLYMFFTCVFATLMQHPTSPVRNLVVSSVVRRALMGLAIGATVIAIVMTPWGKQSGGHFNPAMTLTFYWLGKVAFSSFGNFAPHIEQAAPGVGFG